MLHPDYPTELLLEQIKLEEEMRSATEARYYRNHEKAEEREELSETHIGRNTLKMVIEPFIEGIEEWITSIEAGGAGRRPRALILMKEFGDVDAMAYIFLRHLINTTLTLSNSGKGKLAKKTRVVLSATQAIHDELRMRYFADNRKALLKTIMRDFKRRELPRRRRRDLMIKQFQHQQLEWKADGWDTRNRLGLGLVLLQIFQQATGLVEDVRVTNGPKTIDCISFTPEMLAKLVEAMEDSANLFTVFYPTVIPPRPWEDYNLTSGAYYTTNVEPYTLIKGAKLTFISELENKGIAEVLAPINALQNTGWRVNNTMVEVLEHVWSNGIEVSGLTSADPKPIPEPPQGIDDSEEIAKEYRKECYMIHDMNRRMISKRISVLRTLSLAKRFGGYEAIYFPHDVDSRGRVYPKPAFLNPQGPDYVKSLLEFSEGKPIDTEEAAGFLAIAVANAWGHDKLPLQKRVDWVEANEEMMLQVAHNPTGDLRWTQCDEPFMALRGAIEFAQYSVEGFGYVSHMPIHFDATCSGLQHFSALLSDEVGGYHVNLTGDNERQDIYAAVAKKATESLKALGTTHASIALEIGVTRALCKRPVMIVPYAGTFSACMDYTWDHYKALFEGGEAMPVEMDIIRKHIVPLVAKHVWSAIGDTVIAARVAMDWITKSARIAAKGNFAPFVWTTPDGFVVRQATYEQKTERFNTFLDGKMSKLSITRESNVLDSRKMSSSLSPNFIHSLDACHMRMSVALALETNRCMSFAMIHDSFGVHAADMPTFVEECIKPAFVEMYEGTDLLAKFKKEMEVNLKGDDEFADLPPKGTLDINEVRNSQFFFS